jgi:hypothetical protein
MEANCQLPLDMRLGLNMEAKKEKIPSPAFNRNPGIQPVA